LRGIWVSHPNGRPWRTCVLHDYLIIGT
jgi:hypothetical protein